MEHQFLYRGVSVTLHRKNDGLLIPKATGPFAYEYHWGESGAAWGGITWGASEHNAVVRHQVNQEGFPTSGLSTTPHLERARIYARGRDGQSPGYIYRIDRTNLAGHGVLEFVVAAYCTPSVPEDDEVILVCGDGLPLPSELVVEVIPID
jgi:hypothetical protein